MFAREKQSIFFYGKTTIAQPGWFGRTGKTFYLPAWMKEAVYPP
jgi:hypothetical protein